MKTSAIENKREKWHTNGLTFYYQAGKLCQCRSKRPVYEMARKKTGPRYNQVRSK